MRVLIFIFLFQLSTSSLVAQYAHRDVLPELTGEELLDELVDEYKALILFMSYGDSRDTLFSKVYRKNDSLSCVYSGHTLYMDPAKDPTTTVYLNGASNGINTEHTFPRSKGAEFGNPKSDMHHLFPTRVQVNAERSNFPFGEINDDDTDLWFYKDQAISNKPLENIDLYSEWKWGVFEPREDHKGNVARAMMYFYTMYKVQADNADPNFFQDMAPTLCEWHYSDPVDSLEWLRTHLIAQWQEFPNPFVLDCSLAGRTYCDFISESCETAVSVEEPEISKTSIEQIFYSIENQSIHIDLNLEFPSEINYTVYDSSGKLLSNGIRELRSTDQQTLEIPFISNSDQLVFVNLQLKSEPKEIQLTKAVFISSGF